MNKIDFVKQLQNINLRNSSVLCKLHFRRTSLHKQCISSASQIAARASNRMVACGGEMHLWPVPFTGHHNPSTGETVERKALVLCFPHGFGENLSVVWQSCTYQTVCWHMNDAGKGNIYAAQQLLRSLRRECSHFVREVSTGANTSDMMNAERA